MSREKIIKELLKELATSSVDEILNRIKNLPMAYDLLKKSSEQFGMTEKEYLIELQEVLSHNLEQVCEEVIKKEDTDLGEVAESVWNKGLEVSDLDPRMFRLDSCGALIAHSSYNDENHPLGWKECKILPESMGGDDRIENLRPMQIKNIKSKGDDYPVYKSAVIYDNHQNIYCEKEIVVSSIKQQELENIYKKSHIDDLL